MAWLAIAGLLVCSMPVTHGRTDDDGPSPEEIEAGARLQVFLDRAGFGPGKIDGRPGEFTVKALALYEEAHGKEGNEEADADAVAKDAADADVMPDVSHLDLAGIDPVFIDYAVTEADFEHVGDLSEQVSQQAEQSAMPYRTVAEAVAERFHTDTDFLEFLNQDKMEDIEVGTSLRVPNVEPFELARVIEKAEQDQDDEAQEEEETDKLEQETGTDDAKQDAGATPVTRVVVDGDNNMLSVYVDDKLTAAFPVTIGSGRNESPVGEWKVTKMVGMPTFRYDKAMLNRGVRSDDYHNLPPGPNNPVGVMWIQLNKSGIGLHGTNSPETIGRASSHGCVRLANWDVVRLAEHLDVDVSVEIK